MYHLNVQNIEVIGGAFLWKSITISFVLLVLMRRWFSYQMMKSVMTFLYSRSVPSDTHPTMDVSSEDLRRWQFVVLYLKSKVYKVKRKESVP